MGQPSYIDDEFVFRVQKAVEALRAHPAVVYADADIQFKTSDIWAGLKTDTTQELETLESIFGLTDPIVTLNYTAEHGVVLDIWWNFADTVEPLPENKTYDDYIASLEDAAISGEYIEDMLGNPPEDSGFEMLPETVPNTIPRDESFPVSPPGWNYAGVQWVEDEDTTEAVTSAALYFCHFQDNIAKLWVLYDQNEDLYQINLVEYPSGDSMISFKTQQADLQTELYDAARAWLQSQLATQPPTIHDDFTKTPD